ncbi:MAG TPA: hypothetical protein VHP11_17960, partial [Tepidisphaeraceae bacterium]|nr:hypothetical protein [Tepidisphaeraceae bacterium]
GAGAGNLARGAQEQDGAGMKSLAMMVMAATVAAVTWASAQTLPVAPATAPVTAPARTPTTASTQPAPTSEPTTRPVSIDAEKMLEQLLRAKPGTAKPLQPLPDDDEQVKPRRQKDIAPDVADPALRREGDVISARIGRLQKAEREGDWEFAFESDGKTLQDPPITLLPNRNLARMEAAVKKSGMDLRFRLTGVVTRYHGQNYFLVEKAEIVPEDR